MAGAKDENSFLFRASQIAAIREAKYCTESRADPTLLPLLCRPLQPPPPSASIADEIAKLPKLKDAGALTYTEIDALRARLFDK